MNHKEKSAISRQRILDAAMQEFSKWGYQRTSLNTACSNHHLSKGIIYHYFKGKDDLYLMCVKTCFDEMSTYLRMQINQATGTPEQKVQAYFKARLRFLANNLVYLGIFVDVTFNCPPSLKEQVNACRQEFDDLNVIVLMELLKSRPLKQDYPLMAIVDDFRMYMDYFNVRFKEALNSEDSLEVIIKNHEERCHRQLNIFLSGVLGEDNGK